jgi:hypothetical protein
MICMYAYTQLLCDFSAIFVGRHVIRYSKRFGGLVHTKCLFRYNEPVSPHLAAQLNDVDVSDQIKPFVLHVA